MIDFIDKQFQEIAYNAMVKQSLQLGCGLKDIQILLSLDKENEVEFHFMKSYNKYLKADFVKNILCVRIDFKGYSMLVPPYIQKRLLELREEHKVEAFAEITVMIVPSDVPKRVIMWLYIGGQAKEIVTLVEQFED